MGYTNSQVVLIELGNVLKDIKAIKITNIQLTVSLLFSSPCAAQHCCCRFVSFRAFTARLLIRL